MKIRITLILVVLIFCEFVSQAQTAWFAADTTSAVVSGNHTLRYPWAGGLNAVQYGKVDLNDDGTEDLVVFDRTTSKVSTFIAEPVQQTFHYRPEYELAFPPVTNWMVLADFDNDGEKELFAHTAQGVTVYRKVSNGNGGRRWENFKPHLTTRGLSGGMVNLQVVASDIPALVDFDGDGDLDIITFEAGGDYLELNQNMSMERYGIPDSLEFVRNGDCWGNVRKHTCDDFEFGIACGVTTTPPGNARVMHAGNSLLLHDFNGDGKRDMLLGNVDCNNLNLVFNSAEGLVANFSSYVSAYPETDPATMSVFPAAYLEDVDFDGVKDLLVSPNVYGNDNLTMDFVASGWYYHNAGTDQRPDFRLRQKDFLQSEMVDVGENAAASFFDIDGDGDQDMVIGNRGRDDGQNFRGSLWIYRNNGSPENPVYVLEGDDYLDLSLLPGQTDLQPQWLDFNGDSRVDLGIAAVVDRRLQFYYIPNQGERGGPMQLNPSARVAVSLPGELSVSDRVFFFDYDRDGDADLLVGGVLGNISLYENTGTPGTPVFVLRDAALGGVGPSFSRRYLSLSVGDLDLDGREDILTVDQNGKVNIIYQGEWGQWTKTDTSVIRNPLTGSHSSPYSGSRLHATIADINNDGKPDLAVGTSGGGIFLFRNMLPVTIAGNEPDLRLELYPNPARSSFSLNYPQDAAFEVFDMPGNRVYSGHLSAGIERVVEVSCWKKGVYVVRLTDGTRVLVKKAIVY